jgi:hypothetical protein
MDNKSRKPRRNGGNMPRHRDVAQPKKEGIHTLRQFVRLRRNAMHKPTAGREPAVEFAVVMLFVLGAHLTPFAAHLGLSSMKLHACESIAAVFSYLSVILLTARVVFKERRTIRDAIASGVQISVLPVLGVGAVTAALWMVPSLARGQVTEVIVFALVVVVSQLVSLAIDHRLRPNWVINDIIPVVVVLFAIAWVYSNPHFASAHGEEFVAATTVGASSIHSWQAALSAAGKVFRPLA